MSETKALHIPRKALIARLEEVQAEAVAKRAEATEKQKADRQVVLDAVATLTTDQVANILQELVYSNQKDLISWIEDKVDRKAYVSKDLTPTGIEDALEKQIRVLRLANDTEIEVKPNESVYSYL